ncbi:MAG: alpha/beta hydrolase family protein, partial [Nitrospinota bacterium]
VAEGSYVGLAVGQGASLRERGLHGRHDFEVPVSAAVDYLLQRPDVDPDRIALMGISMGGYLAPRAASFEHRLRACIAWGAIYDFSEVWDTRPDDHPLMRHFVWLIEAKDVPDARRRARQFRLEGVVDKIRCPFLITHGEDDVQVSVSHAVRMHEAARCEKRLKTFSVEETGSTHCQMDNLSLAHRYMFDWLEEKMR